MKTIILKMSAILLMILVFSACKEKKEESTEECKNLNRDNIIGQWKLIEIIINVNYSQLDTTDYSIENIIFDFQENNKLVVIGNIVDSLSLFVDFQEGEHFYEYQKPNVCPTCLPGPNLIIDNPKPGMSWERSYFCHAPLSEETMMIDKMNWMGKEGDDSSWSMKFIKLN